MPAFFTQRRAQGPDEEMIGTIQARRYAYQQQHAQADLQSKLAISFYLGKQWDAIHPMRGLWTPPPRKNEVRRTHNKIARVVDAKIAKLCAAPPSYMCYPRKNDSEGLRGAQINQTTLDWCYLTSGLDVELNDAVWWALNTSYVAIFFGWDPHGGRQVREPRMQIDPVTGGYVPVVDPQTGQPAIDTFYEEMPAARVLSCFEFGYDASGGSFRRAQWAYHDELMRCDDVEKRFGVRPAGDRIEAGDRFWNRQPADYLSDSFGFVSEAPDADDEWCVLTNYWHLPCAAYPDGLRAIVTKGEVILQQPHPYAHKKLPFVTFCERPLGSSSDGYPVSWRLIGPQVEWNRRISQLEENCATTSNPALLVEQLSEVKIEALDGLPSSVLRYRKAPETDKPMWLNGAQLGQAVYEDLSRIDESFWRISETETLTSNVSADSSAVAIQQRREEDDSVLAITRNQMRFALRAGGKMWLSNFRQFVKRERAIRVLGDDKAPFLVSGADVDPDIDVDVEIESGSERSKAVKDDRLMKLIELERDNPEMRMELSQLLSVSGIDRAFRVASEDNAFVERQIQRVRETKKGEEFKPWERLEKTAALMRLYLVSAEFEAWSLDEKKALLATWESKREELAKRAVAEREQMIADATTKARVDGAVAAAGKPGSTNTPDGSSGQALDNDRGPRVP